MATTSGNSSLAPNSVSTSIVNAQQVSTELKNHSSWADRVENSIMNTQVANTPCRSVNARFFILKREEGTFAQIPPFFIPKVIQSLIGNPKCVKKKLRSGDILIKVENDKQAENLKKCKSFGNMPINVLVHNTLNSSRGVMFEPDLLYISEEEILENLRDQNVIAVRRINIRKDGNDIRTKHLILTFDTPKLPQSIKAGNLNCSIRPYIPNPL